MSSRRDKTFWVRRPSRHTPRRKQQRRRKRASGPGAVRRKKKEASTSPKVIWSGLRNDRSKLPDWKDLSTDNEHEAGATRGSEFLERVSTARFLLMLFALLIGAVLYVGHVHATQHLVAELEQARAENLQLHMEHSRLKGDFDRVTGPSVIHERATALGLQRSAGALGTPIIIPDTN